MPNKKVIKQDIQEDYSSLITETDVAKFIMIYPMIVSTRNEMRTLSSKKQDGVLNNLKVKMINKLIDSARELLVKEPTLDYLEQLDEDMLPQNSDVVLILCQYIEALDQYKSKNQVVVSFGNYKWRTQENPKPSKED